MEINTQENYYTLNSLPHQLIYPLVRASFYSEPLFLLKIFTHIPHTLYKETKIKADVISALMIQDGRL